MHPDHPATNPAPIIAAAKRRHELTRAKAIQAIRELDHAGTPITFAAVAGQAGVSRSWLYRQPDLRDQVQHLRKATTRQTTAPVPADQRASDASLLRRLQAAHARNQQLLDERTDLLTERDRLRRQLAHALGEHRHPAHPPPAPTTGHITLR